MIHKSFCQTSEFLFMSREVKTTCLFETGHFAPRATDTVGDVKTGIVSDFTRPSAGGTGL